MGKREEKVEVPVALLEYCLRSLTWVRGEYGRENDRRACQLERILKKHAAESVKNK